MTEIRMTAAKKAVAWLTSAGCKFAVVMPDGTTVGELQVASAAKQKIKRVKIYNFDGELGYVKTMKAMAPGDVQAWKMDEKRLPAFKSCVTSTACRYWGSGTYEMTDTNGAITIMRCS